MHNVCNVCMPQAICDVISSIGIGIRISAAAADSIGCQHGIGLTLLLTIGRIAYQREGGDGSTQRW